jgi:hypothetical protein
MKIEITKRNYVKEFWQHLHSKLENLMFSIVLKLPDAIVPQFVKNWLDSYVTRRAYELQQEIIRQRWEKDRLEQFIKEMHEKEKHS